jgi:hypothetical protein
MLLHITLVFDYATMSVVNLHAPPQMFFLIYFLLLCKIFPFMDNRVFTIWFPCNDVYKKLFIHTFIHTSGQFVVSQTHLQHQFKNAPTYSYRSVFFLCLFAKRKTKKITFLEYRPKKIKQFANRFWLLNNSTHEMNKTPKIINSKKICWVEGKKKE